MTSSAQLEREAEQARSQLAQTLEELRARITPGHLMDQVVDYTKDSGSGEFVRNLGQQMSANPLPVCVMAAGMAWLMLSTRRAPAMPAGGPAGAREHIGGAARNMVGAAGDAASATRETAESRARALNAQAREAAASVSESVSSTYAAGKEQAAAI